MEILERNKEIYTLYKSIFLKNYQLEDPNVICRRVSNLSEFAYKSHVGIFRDDFIEDCLHWIGSPILKDHLPTIPKSPPELETTLMLVFVLPNLPFLII